MSFARHVCVAVLLAMGPAAIACASPTPAVPCPATHQTERRRDGIMTADELAKELKSRVYKQRSDFEAGLIADARQGPRRAVELALDGDEGVRAAARVVVKEIGDLAIRPLTDAPQPASAEDRVWVLERLVEADRGLRASIASLLERMLDDQAPLPGPEPGGPAYEGFVPRLRVCDQAYRMMRNLVLFGEPYAEDDRYWYYYHRFPNPRRDVEIHGARASGNYKRKLTEEDLMQAYPELPSSSSANRSDAWDETGITRPFTFRM